MTAIPEAVRARMLAVHGHTAESWIAALPALIRRLETEWTFAAGAPFDGLSYAYVAAATLADGTPAVLKAQPPDAESRSEVAALRAWDGQGAVRLLAADPANGVSLLDRVLPGHSAASLADDDEATRVIVTAMARLHIFPATTDGLLRLGPWGRALLEYTPREDGPIPPTLHRAAVAAWQDLVASSPAPVLLHGDLHHENVLYSQRGGWLAIDPKGVLGDPSFEPSALFFNPLDRLAREPNLPALIARRLDVMCEAAGLDRARVAAWGFARAVLSVCWSALSGSPVLPHIIAVARTLQGVMRRE